MRRDCEDKVRRDAVELLETLAEFGGGAPPLRKQVLGCVRQLVRDYPDDDGLYELALRALDAHHVEPASSKEMVDLRPLRASVLVLLEGAVRRLEQHTVGDDSEPLRDAPKYASYGLHVFLRCYGRRDKSGKRGTVLLRQMHKLGLRNASHCTQFNTPLRFEYASYVLLRGFAPTP